MNVERLQNLLLYKYRYTIAYIVVALTSIGALFYRLGDLMPGLSPREVDQGAAISGESTTILEQGLYLPYNIVQTISTEILGESVLALRLPSAIFGALILIMLFALIHTWHREKIAIASVLFLATSSWFLHFARSGTPYVYTAFALVLLFLSGTLLRHSNHRTAALVVSALAIPFALYSPLVTYIFILYLVLYSKEILALSKKLTPLEIVMIAMVGTMTLAPLLYAFITDANTLKLWLGVSAGLPSITGFFSNIFDSLNHVLWRSSENPEFHLGQLAMLDIFTASMAALGLYHYEQHFNMMRTRFIIYGLGVSFIVTGFTQTETAYFMIAPLIYILAATGIVTLLNQWNKIFPVNPFARTLGLLPLALVILLTSQYHLDRYFSAWANNPQARSIHAVEPTLLEASAVQELEPGSKTLIITPEDEHAALTYLLTDQREDKQIDIATAQFVFRNPETVNSYDSVYLDGAQGGSVRAQLDQYLSSVVLSDKDSKPVAYTLFDLSQKVDSEL